LRYFAEPPVPAEASSASSWRQTRVFASAPDVAASKQANASAKAAPHARPGSRATVIRSPASPNVLPELPN